MPDTGYGNNAMGQLSSQREQAIGGLKKRWRVEADALEQSGLSDEQFNKSAASLNAKYKLQTLELDDMFRGKAQQVKQIHDMVQQRRMSEQEGFRQIQATSGGPVPRVARQPERPLTPGQRNTIGKDQDKFIASMELDPAQRSIWTGKKHEIRDLASMRDQYAAWVEQSGYMWFTPKQKQQADYEWDSRMRSHPMYSGWFSDKEKRNPVPEISAAREQMSGRRSIRNAMSKKVGVVSPIGRSITPKQRPQKKRSDPLGLGL